MGDGGGSPSGGAAGAGRDGAASTSAAGVQDGAGASGTGDPGGAGTSAAGEAGRADAAPSGGAAGAGRDGAASASTAGVQDGAGASAAGEAGSADAVGGAAAGDAGGLNLSRGVGTVGDAGGAEPRALIGVHQLQRLQEEKQSPLLVSSGLCSSGPGRAAASADDAGRATPSRGTAGPCRGADGHNWLYPVCFGVFDAESNDNWIWFMRQLREAIGSPRGLAICTDAGQAVMAGAAEVFPEAEKRECMFHLVSNFKKRYHGKVFDDHLWAAAYSWNPYLFEKHWIEMEKANPAATDYLRQWHTRLWSRSQFSPTCKVDYVTNNLAECLNNWLKHHKSLNLDDFMDKIRQLIMVKWNQRRKVGRKLHGLIMPHIIKKLNEESRALSLEVVECSEEVAEVTALGGSGFRFVVNLEERTCSCRKWQVCGIPCKHALAFITSLPNTPIEQYVDMYYSIDKFRTAYSELIPAMPDKSQWPKSTHGFFMHPPLLKATAGRPKTERYKGCSENKKKKGQHQCPICKDYGHHWHNCKKGNPDDIAAMMAVRGPPKKKAKTAKSAQSSIVPIEDEAPATSMSFPPSQTLEATTKKTTKQLDSGSGASKCHSLETTSRKKGKLVSSDSGPSKRRISRSGSNQPETIPIEFSAGSKQRVPPKKAKRQGKKKVISKEKTDVNNALLDSPAMGTRSKKLDPASPSMGTRSKRRLSL